MTMKHEFKLDWYLIKRDESYQVVSVLPGSDPLYGNGSWNLVAGPFSSEKEAQDKFQILWSKNEKLNYWRN
jgi:hypothetical protein